MLLGAAIGDIIGSRFEFNNHKSTRFTLFSPNCSITDDTVCTVAVAEWALSDFKADLVPIMRKWCHQYPRVGYGGMFVQWLISDFEPEPYNSWGNGSAMRVSPVAWKAETLEDVLEYAKQSAEITHNHPDGIRGAQATAAAIFWARTGKDKAFIKQEVEARFGYDLSATCDEIRPHYEFNESCNGTVPEAIIAFLESSDFEDAMRLAISLGGDSDTLAAITGSIAEAFYGVPEDIEIAAKRYIPAEMQAVLAQIK